MRSLWDPYLSTPRQNIREKVYKLGAESLEWSKISDVGMALIAEDLKLLNRLQLAQHPRSSTDWTAPTPLIGMPSVLTLS